MGERTEASVAQQNVVLAKLGMDLRHSGHIVSAQRRGHDLHEHSRTDMEQRQKVGDGKTAARLLFAGLAEVLLKFGCVRHGEAGAVGHEHPVPMPGLGVVDYGSELFGNAAEQLSKQRKGQATARLAVGRASERETTDSNHMIDGGIAVEDLVEEQMDDGDGVQQTSAPRVLDLTAGVQDLGSVELLGGHFWNRRRMLTIR